MLKTVKRKLRQVSLISTTGWVTISDKLNLSIVEMEYVIKKNIESQSGTTGKFILLNHLAKTVDFMLSKGIIKQYVTQKYVNR